MAHLKGRVTKLLNFCLLLLHLSSCITNSSQQFLNAATRLGFEEITIPTEQFNLKIYLNMAANHNHNKHHRNDKGPLHIYLAGDGTPFIQNRYINQDPTPSTHLILALMAQDSAPSVLIGRPCYHRSTALRNCNDTRWWTSHRYSTQVLKSLDQAIDQLQEKFNKQTITLIGYSGGGTLATLLAHHRPVETLVTINANLNTTTWARHHGFSPLHGSINPSQLQKLPVQTSKHHLIGEQDNNVLSHHWLPYFETQANTKIHTYPNFTHACCWTEIWSDFLHNHIGHPHIEQPTDKR